MPLCVGIYTSSPQMLQKRQAGEPPAYAVVRGVGVGGWEAGVRIIRQSWFPSVVNSRVYSPPNFESPN